VDLAIDYFLFTIVPAFAGMTILFLSGLCSPSTMLRTASVALKTVLIRVNPCQGYLKKQSQFIRTECCVMRIAERYLKKQSQFWGKTKGKRQK